MTKTHDQFCRCRVCKPPHPDNCKEGRGWLLLALMVLWGAAFAISVLAS